jgi:hypothetical protein
MYLGDLLNIRGTVSEEINKRIITRNKAYYANSQLLKSTLLSRSTKLKLYRTLIRLEVPYTAPIKGNGVFTIGTSHVAAL